MNYGTKTVWLVRLHLKEEHYELQNKLNSLACELDYTSRRNTMNYETKTVWLVRLHLKEEHY